MDTTLTSQVKTYNKNFSAGFTLFEILAVLVLIGVATTVGFRLLNSQSDRDDLDVAKETLERNANFAASEAVIRNRIIRLTLHLDKTPQTYSLEIASTAQLLLPEKTDDSAFAKTKDKDVEKKESEKFNQNFAAVEGVKPEEFSIDIKIFAAGNLETQKIEDKGDYPIYFYPSGEKDPTLLIIGTDKEIMGISFDAFRDRVMTKYFLRDQSEIKSTVDSIFKDWKS